MSMGSTYSICVSWDGQKMTGKSYLDLHILTISNPIFHPYYWVQVFQIIFLELALPQSFYLSIEVLKVLRSCTQSEMSMNLLVQDNFV